MRNGICIKEKKASDGFEYSLSNNSREMLERTIGKKIYTKIVHISRKSRKEFEKYNGTFFKYVISAFNCNNKLNIPVSIVDGKGEIIYKK